VFNFIAVAIVAQFEEYFYMSLNGDMSQKLLDYEFTSKTLII
jgi:hypothetical protein